MCASVHACVRGHVFMCAAWMWVRDHCCFVLLHADTSVSKSRSIRKYAQTCNNATPGLFSCYLKHSPYHTSLLPTIILHLHPNSLPNCHPKTSFYVNTSQPLLPIFRPASYLCKPLRLESLDLPHYPYLIRTSTYPTSWDHISAIKNIWKHEYKQRYLT